MSVSFVKLFNTLTDSSVWALPDNFRVIWISMLSMANSRGNVHASILGVANRARKSVEEVEAALRVFMDPDPYSRTRELEGRRLVEIDGGWHFVTWEKHRGALNAESARERKRKWWQANRSADVGDPLDAKLDELDKTRKHGSVSVLSGSGSDPEGVQGEPKRPVEAEGVPVLFHTLDGWNESEVEDEAVAAGLTRESYRSHIAGCRNITIGGVRGVRCRATWVRQQLGRWKTWDEADRAKAHSAAVAGPRSSFGGGRDQRGPLTVEASEKHRRFAKKHGVDVDEIVAHLNRTRAPENLGVGRATELIGELLSKQAREQAKARAAT